tara:strand:+ start:808 stop:1488 length:681 start_codon:yes stop_codon:yes gene_type:complete
MLKQSFENLMCKSWLEHLWPALSSLKMKSSYAAIKKDKSRGCKVFPKYEDTFNAFKYTPWDDVKVVIIGKDPYCAEGMSHGLAFSTQSDDTPTPLKNILKEVENDVYDGFNLNRSVTNDLTSWTSQGVLLLNTSLTVKMGWPGSHLKYWEAFTVHTIKELNEWKSGVIYLLWGIDAQAFKKHINLDQNHILEASNASSFEFLGCKHFSKTNELLLSMNGENSKIIW